MLSRISPHLLYLTLLSIVVLYGANVLGKMSSDYSEQSKELSRLSDVRSKQISKALEEERKEREDIVKRMQSELERNREVYEKKIAELTSKKSKEVKEFVAQNGSDVKEMANSLSRSTGFKVYDGK